MVSNLSGAALEKALKELGEVPEKREEQISELRTRLEAWVPDPEDTVERELKLDRIDDDKFLLCFLRARKFDLDRATTLFVNYYKFRAKYAYMVGEVSVETAEPTLRENLVSVLPERTIQGCKVLVARFGRIELEVTPMEMVLKMMLVILDKLIEEEETQVHGIVLCQDLEGMTFLKMMAIARKEHFSKGAIFELLQDCFPARFKGLHILNQPWYISILFSIARPFMKQKTRDRLHMHGADYDSLQEFLPPEHLPIDFGGELDSLDTYSAVNLFTEQLNSSGNNNNNSNTNTE